MKNVVRFLFLAAVVVAASPSPSHASAPTPSCIVGGDAQSYATGVQDAQQWKNSNPARLLPGRIVFAQTKCDQYTSDPNDGVRLYDPQLDDYWNGYLAALQGEVEEV
ncbi:hypothetical protein [Hymenobacter cellulosivorans]|uniref:Uncharacterized protein n=1 Tax=Hymenobacter cellulosivorans TaxID=2932249 RepID=A0ABY4F8Q4_9BACT|nr:hypothetical protein [Hymenobacter cellulosivorans]UOQ53050.1 hypothetical protein MUN80_25350 [Hymenobacter cellulosivorans]